MVGRIAETLEANKAVPRLSPLFFMFVQWFRDKEKTRRNQFSSAQSLSDSIAIALNPQPPASRTNVFRGDWMGIGQMLELTSLCNKSPIASKILTKSYAILSLVARLIYSLRLYSKRT